MQMGSNPIQTAFFSLTLFQMKLFEFLIEAMFVLGGLLGVVGGIAIIVLRCINGSHDNWTGPM